MRYLIAPLCVVMMAGCTPGTLPPPSTTELPLPTTIDGPSGRPLDVDVTDDPFELAIRVVTTPPSVTDWSSPVRLRTWIRRADGDRSHQLYTSTNYIGEWKHFHRAAVIGQSLEFVGIAKDVGPCSSPSCSLTETFAATIPDSLLRAAERDSLAVKFFAQSGEALLVVVRADVIGAHIRAVDSVRVAQQRR